MKDYKEQANINKVELLESGSCQFCGSNVTRGVHQCVELFGNGFQGIDFSASENHVYLFLTVDAHTLQHPEIHGRWNNHFHLTRLHLILVYNFKWKYKHSPRLSNYLKEYKIGKKDEHLTPPIPSKRGNLTITDILKYSSDEDKLKSEILNWSNEVYLSWSGYHPLIEKISKDFMNH